MNRHMITYDTNPYIIYTHIMHILKVYISYTIFIVIKYMTINEYHDIKFKEVITIYIYIYMVTC